MCVGEMWESLTYDEAVKIEKNRLPQNAAEGDTTYSGLLKRCFVFADGLWQMISNIPGIETPCTMELDKETKSLGDETFVCRGIYGEWQFLE